MVGSGHHFQLLAFTQKHLKIDVIGIDGGMIDSYTIAAPDVKRVKDAVDRAQP